MSAFPISLWSEANEWRAAFVQTHTLLHFNGEFFDFGLGIHIFHLPFKGDSLFISFPLTRIKTQVGLVTSRDQYIQRVVVTSIFTICCYSA
jgi:hypothetical protein